MKTKKCLTSILTLLSAAILTAGCATLKNSEITEDDIEDMSGIPLTSYSDYGEPPVPDTTSGLIKYTVYVGGVGGCENGAYIFAKRKLDRYKKKNRFASYVIKQTRYAMLPLSKCDLFVEFKGYSTKPDQ